jgi:DNA-binding NtrC family response regulator
MDGKVIEAQEEYKELLAYLRQAARKMLSIRAKMPYAKFMFEHTMVLEALAITKDNRSRAATLLGVHRNTFTRHLLPQERKCGERYAAKRPPVRAGRLREHQLKFPASTG